MKKLLFTLYLAVSAILFYSCGSDDNTDTDPNPIVPTTTGAISKNGVNFDNKDLKVESATIAKSQLKSTFVTTYLTLLFNDNVQVVIEANIDEGTTIPFNDAYDTYIKYATKVTFNILNNNTIIESESFIDEAKIKNMYNNDLNTLTLNFKNKYEYKGEITLPETPEIEVPELIDNNDIKTILQSREWMSESEGFLGGTSPIYSSPYYLTFFSSRIVFSAQPIDSNPTIVTIPMSYSVRTFTLREGGDVYVYAVKSITTSEVYIKETYFIGGEPFYVDIVLKKYIKK